MEKKASTPIKKKTKNHKAAEAAGGKSLAAIERTARTGKELDGLTKLRAEYVRKRDEAGLTGDENLTATMPAVALRNRRSSDIAFLFAPM